MVAEVKSDAPELALDAQTQSGFVKWFNSLPKVWGGWGGGFWRGARAAAVARTHAAAPASNNKHKKKLNRTTASCASSTARAFTACTARPR